MKESYEKQISFPQINSSGFELIFEYLYTGTINKESLTKEMFMSRQITIFKKQ